jgi:hypothetical protein
MSYDTNKQNSRMVTGLFPDRASAERAYGTVSDRGYTKDDVNLMMSDSTRKTHFATPIPNSAARQPKAPASAPASAAPSAPSWQASPPSAPPSCSQAWAWSWPARWQRHWPAPALAASPAA